MQISLQRGPIEEVQTNALVLLVFQDRREDRLGLGELFDAGEISGKPFETTLLHNVPGMHAKRHHRPELHQRADEGAGLRQKTLEATAPPMRFTILLPAAVVRVLPIWKMKTACGLPLPLTLFPLPILSV